MNTSLLVFIVVALVSIVLIVIGFLQKNKAQKAAETWLPASGVILSSRVETHRSRDSKGRTRVSYRPVVNYQYQVMGQSFNGDQIGFGNGSYGSAKADKLIAPYPQGAQVNVHYDPADPAKAVLETRNLSSGSMFVFGAILLGLGVIGLIINLL